MRDQPLTLWAVPATLEILRNHIFNWSFGPISRKFRVRRNPSFDTVKSGRRYDRAEKSES